MLKLQIEKAGFTLKILFFLKNVYAAGSLYVHPVCAGVRRGQERVSDLLELELFTVVLSHHIGAGNWIWLLWKNGQHS